jgi:uncharacterized protein (DUF2252 family)
MALALAVGASFVGQAASAQTLPVTAASRADLVCVSFISGVTSPNQATYLIDGRESSRRDLARSIAETARGKRLVGFYFETGAAIMGGGMRAIDDQRARIIELGEIFERVEGSEGTPSRSSSHRNCEDLIATDPAETTGTTQ